MTQPYRDVPVSSPTAGNAGEQLQWRSYTMIRLRRRLRFQGLRHLGGGFAAELGADGPAGFRDDIEIDAVRDAEAVHEIDHVLGADIARRALGIRTTAEACDRGVE